MLDRSTLERAAGELAQRDPVMARLAAEVGPPRLGPRQRSHFEALARAVVFQQLAGRAAAAIWGRLRAQVDGPLTPGKVLDLDDTALSAAGLSTTKAACIRDLAVRVSEGTLRLDRLRHLDDETVVERLTTVRGVGRWTAQMFLLFQLRRPDVWPTGDYGVRKGYAIAHGLDELPTPQALTELGEPLRPWRSVAAWYLWRVTDTRTPGG